MSTPETRVFVRSSATSGLRTTSTELELILPPGTTPELSLIRGAVLSLARGESAQAQPAATAPRAATIAPPAIGQAWPGQGGIYAGVFRGAEGQSDYHLILAEQALGELPWGGSGIEVAGCANARDGRANTQALVQAPASHPAAEACAALCVDGHSDFYLPARFELALLYAHLQDRFEKTWHWSSTQYSARYAWIQDFDNGNQDDYDKGYEARVRAVRRFNLESFSPSAAEGGSRAEAA